MCRRANLSRCFIIAGYSLGINIGLSLPYVAVANNVLCTDYFGTEVSSGGLLAIFCTAVYAVVGMLWITYYEKRMKKKGIGYVPAENEQVSLDDEVDPKDLPHWILAVIPMIVPIIALNALKLQVEFALILGVAVIDHSSVQISAAQMGADQKTFCGFHQYNNSNCHQHICNRWFWYDHHSDTGIRSCC